MAPIESRDTGRQEYAQFLKALGARLRKIRKERGWTLRDMVIQHGFHLSAWQGYEAGRLGMSVPSLLKISKALGLRSSELLRQVEESVPDSATIAEENAPPVP